MAHPIDLLVDVQFLLDIGVGTRDVGLRLVIVVVGDEVLDRVVGKEAAKLAVELGRQRLVGREDEGRPLGGLDHFGHGEGLAGAGDAEQHLVALIRRDALDQLVDRGRLVALGLVIGDDAKGATALRLVRTGRPVGGPRRAIANVGIAELEQAFQRLDGGGGAGEAEGMVFRAGRLEFLLRHFAEAVGLRFDQRGIEQRGEMVAERLQLGPRRLRLRRATRFFRGGHGPEYGARKGNAKERMRTARVLQRA